MNIHYVYLSTGESSRATPSSEHRPPFEARPRQTPEPTKIYQGSLAGTPITTASAVATAAAPDDAKPTTQHLPVQHDKPVAVSATEKHAASKFDALAPSSKAAVLEVKKDERTLPDIHELKHDEKLAEIESLTSTAELPKQTTVSKMEPIPESMTSSTLNDMSPSPPLPAFNSSGIPMEGSSMHVFSDTVNTSVSNDTDHNVTLDEEDFSSVEESLVSEAHSVIALLADDKAESLELITDVNESEIIPTDLIAEEPVSLESANQENELHANNSISSDILEHFPNNIPFISNTNDFDVNNADDDTTEVEQFKSEYQQESEMVASDIKMELEEDVETGSTESININDGQQENFNAVEHGLKYPLDQQYLHEESLNSAQGEFESSLDIVRPTEHYQNPVEDTPMTQHFTDINTKIHTGETEFATENTDELITSNDQYTTQDNEYHITQDEDKSVNYLEAAAVESSEILDSDRASIHEERSVADCTGEKIDENDNRSTSDKSEYNYSEHDDADSEKNQSHDLILHTMSKQENEQQYLHLNSDDNSDDNELPITGNNEIKDMLTNTSTHDNNTEEYVIAGTARETELSVEFSIKGETKNFNIDNTAINFDLALTDVENTDVIEETCTNDEMVEKMTQNELIINSDIQNIFVASAVDNDSSSNEEGINYNTESSNFTTESMTTMDEERYDFLDDNNVDLVEDARNNVDDITHRNVDEHDAHIKNIHDQNEPHFEQANLMAVNAITGAQIHNAGASDLVDKYEPNSMDSNQDLLSELKEAEVKSDSELTSLGMDSMTDGEIESESIFTREDLFNERSSVRRTSESSNSTATDVHESANLFSPGNDVPGNAFVEDYKTNQNFENTWRTSDFKLPENQEQIQTNENETLMLPNNEFSDSETSDVNDKITEKQGVENATDNCTRTSQVDIEQNQFSFSDFSEFRNENMSIPTVVLVEPSHQPGSININNESSNHYNGLEIKNEIGEVDDNYSSSANDNYNDNEETEEQKRSDEQFRVESPDAEFTHNFDSQDIANVDERDSLIADAVFDQQTTNEVQDQKFSASGHYSFENNEIELDRPVHVHFSDVIESHGFVADEQIPSSVLNSLENYNVDDNNEEQAGINQSGEYFQSHENNFIGIESNYSDELDEKVADVIHKSDQIDNSASSVVEQLNFSGILENYQDENFPTKEQQSNVNGHQSLFSISETFDIDSNSRIMEPVEVENTSGQNDSFKLSSDLTFSEIEEKTTGNPFGAPFNPPHVTDDTNNFPQYEDVVSTSNFNNTENHPELSNQATREPTSDNDHRSLSSLSDDFIVDTNDKDIHNDRSNGIHKTYEQYSGASVEENRELSPANPFGSFSRDDNNHGYYENNESNLVSYKDVERPVDFNREIRNARFSSKQNDDERSYSSDDEEKTVGIQSFTAGHLPPNNTDKNSDNISKENENILPSYDHYNVEGASKKLYYDDHQNGTYLAHNNPGTQFNSGFTSSFMTDQKRSTPDSEFDSDHSQSSGHLTNKDVSLGANTNLDSDNDSDFLSGSNGDPPNYLESASNSLSPVKFEEDFSRLEPPNISRASDLYGIDDSNLPEEILSANGKAGVSTEKSFPNY